MGRRYVAEIGPGEIIESQTFLVLNKDLRTTNQGSLYIHAVLGDRTGQIVARAWSASEAMYNIMPRGGLINVKGRSESYKGNLQFIIEAIRPVDGDTVDLAEFLPATDGDVEEMWSRVTKVLATIKDPAIRALVDAFVADEQKMKAFRTAPAARDMHHAYIGGLLEHTMNVLEMAQLVAPRYRELNADLVLAGVFLHDLGKTAELGYSTNFEYTDEGQLLGHIAICAQWIGEMADRVAQSSGKPFPTRTRWLLQHIVLSHHGKMEFGSPKTPAIPEAFAVHFLDNLDAKVVMAIRAIKEDRDADANWTGFHRGLETRVYKAGIGKNEGQA
ncbi:MAG: HD domain-containing protein [Phycisphaerales bacterium]|nr:HD domain-containing protein [Phycisphaerales bacterium]